MKAICPKCGTVVASQVKRCPNCGRRMKRMGKPIVTKGVR